MILQKVKIPKIAYFRYESKKTNVLNIRFTLKNKNYQKNYQSNLSLNRPIMPCYHQHIITIKRTKPPLLWINPLDSCCSHNIVKLTNTTIEYCPIKPWNQSSSNSYKNFKYIFILKF